MAYVLATAPIRAMLRAKEVFFMGVAACQIGDSFCALPLVRCLRIECGVNKSTKCASCFAASDAP
jgi:hypothetical protein